MKLSLLLALMLILISAFPAWAAVPPVTIVTAGYNSTTGQVYGTLSVSSANYSSVQNGVYAGVYTTGTPTWSPLLSFTVNGNVYTANYTIPWSRTYMQQTVHNVVYNNAQTTVLSNVYDVTVPYRSSSSSSPGGGSSSTTTTTTTPTTPVSNSITADKGGTVSSSDGSVSVTIPAGALSGDGVVNITEVTGTAIPTTGVNLTIGSKVFNITVTGASLANSVTLTFTYDKTKFADVSADKIGLYYYNVNRGAWTYVGGDVDTATGKVTAEVPHFTTFAIMANPNLPTLKDIDTHWAKKDIKRLVGMLAISGYPDGTFKPENSITRAEFATILAKAMGWSDNASAAKFNDAVPDWAKGSVGAAVYKGVIKGYEDNTFRSDKLITRAEVAVMIVRALGKSASDSNLTFNDASDVPDWATSSVATAVKEGIVKGLPGNVFNPTDNASRAEAATMINRLLKDLKI